MEKLLAEKDEHIVRQRSEFAMSKIQSLHEIESELREQNCSQEEIVIVRKEKSQPILIELDNWMKSNLPHILQSSPIGQAIYYALPRWEALGRYLLRGDLLIDNIIIENSIRPVAIGRKYYLFAGSHDGAKRAAMIYSFFGTCKMNGVNPQIWLADVLTKIADTKSSQLLTLLPHNCKGNQ